MKINIMTMLAAFLAAAIVFSGCTKDNVDTEQLKQLKPNDVVERVLAGLRTGETDSLVDYFAADVSRDIIKKRLADRAASVEIQTTRIDKPTEKKNTAIVRYVYVYTEKKTDKDGNKILGDKMREAGTAVLVKEDGIWKIRLLDAKLADRADKWVVQELGAKLDQDGEIALFKDCVLAVEITKLAEQMYAADNKGEYTNNAGLLSNYITDYDPEACATLKIHSIGVNEKGENDYRITAETKNMPVCSIWATKNKTYPDSWEKKCLGQKNPIAN